MSNEKDTEEVDKVEPQVNTDLARVIEKVEGADSILIALSKDPSVDDMCAAIGLELMLDTIGKHATAIYSGKTPNVLQFLRPEETFEANTNSLQDFIIALDKDKADHLRYKIDGDFVKVYITPYKTTINEDDLEFSHGDINVDLVISLNVKDEGDLDAALAKHGRILHNAGVVSISSSIPSKLGGIEWNKASVSSISEMIVELFTEMKKEIPKDAATALLTGIAAATERFSNDKTTPEAMSIGSRLMGTGADQQLIMSNIARLELAQKEEPKVEEIKPNSVEIDDEEGSSEESDEKSGEENNENASPEEQLEKMIAEKRSDSSVNDNRGTLMDELLNATKEKKEEAPAPEVVSMSETASTSGVTSMPEVASTPEVTSMPEVAAQTPSLANDAPTEPVTVAVPEVPAAPEVSPAKMPEMTTVMPEATPVTPPTDEQVLSINRNGEAPEITPGDSSEVAAEVSKPAASMDGVYDGPQDMTQLEDKTISPMTEEPKDYGAMMEEELAEPLTMNNVMQQVPTVDNSTQGVPAANVEPASTEAALNPVMTSSENDLNDMVNQMVAQAQQNAPATQMQPEVQTEPAAPVASETLEVPETPAASDTPEIPEASVELPPPPAPDIAMAAMPPVQPTTMGGDESEVKGIPETPEGVQQITAPTEQVSPVVVQPEPVQDPASVQPVEDPGAFKIPGM